mmetsp:Transcript_109413/g.233840  ORF Transcript_109413/g.233840 Transcript_109413/m.233840 type:complete len:279 (-) Transcript_109413:1301-2137(-)
MCTASTLTSKRLASAISTATLTCPWVAPMAENVISPAITVTELSVAFTSEMLMSNELVVVVFVDAPMVLEVPVIDAVVAPAVDGLEVPDVDAIKVVEADPLELLVVKLPVMSVTVVVVLLMVVVVVVVEMLVEVKLDTEVEVDVEVEVEVEAHPRPEFRQHHEAFILDQPFSKLCNPARQSYGSVIVDVVVTVRVVVIHHSFFAEDQPTSQLSNPIAQSNRDVVVVIVVIVRDDVMLVELVVDVLVAHPTAELEFSQQYDFFSLDQAKSADSTPTKQS